MAQMEIMIIAPSSTICEPECARVATVRESFVLVPLTPVTTHPFGTKSPTPTFSGAGPNGTNVP